MQNSCKIVYFALSLSQSCSTKKSIWRHYIDYLALLNTQNDTLTGYDRHRNPFFRTEKHDSPVLATVQESVSHGVTWYDYDIGLLNKTLEVRRLSVI
mgnify:CR=1 FL=1